MGPRTRKFSDMCLTCSLAFLWDPPYLDAEVYTCGQLLQPSLPEVGIFVLSRTQFIMSQSNTTIRENWRCFLACSIIMMSPFQYGLDFGLIGGLQAMVGFLQVFGHRAPHVPSGWNIDPTRQQLISSLMTLGAFITSACAGLAATKLGRRHCLWIAAVACCVSNIIMMTTTHIGALYVGRFFIGCANGWFMTHSQLYLQECSPARYRGLFISGFQFFTSFVCGPPPFSLAAERKRD